MVGGGSGVRRRRKGTGGEDEKRRGVEWRGGEGGEEELGTGEQELGKKEAVRWREGGEVQKEEEGREGGKDTGQGLDGRR